MENEWWWLKWLKGCDPATGVKLEESSLKKMRANIMQAIDVEPAQAHKPKKPREKLWRNTSARTTSRI